MPHSIHHYVLPHESNNFKARLLHQPFLLFYAVLLLVFQFGTVWMKNSYPDILGYATNITVEKVLEYANTERARANLPPLTMSPELSNAALQKAHDMFEKNYWAHISPTGVTPWTFILGAGYNYTYAGENLAKNFNSSDEVVTAWMNSPTHRANILKPEYKEIGLAVVNGKLLGEETTLVVQEFGARGGAGIMAMAPRPTVSVPTAVPVFAEAVEVPVVENPTVPAIANVQPVETNVSDYAPSFMMMLLGGRFNRTITLLVAQFLLMVLLIDAVYMWRHRTVRVSGHSLAHIVFFASLIGALGATGVGAIL